MHRGPGTSTADTNATGLERPLAATVCRAFEYVLPPQHKAVQPNPSTLTSDLGISTANNSPTATVGTCSLSQDNGLRRFLPWVFVAADNHCAILGADFPAAVDLLVDCRQFRLHDKTSNPTVRSISSDASLQLVALNPGPENPFRQLLAKHPGLIRPNFDVIIQHRTLFTTSGPLALPCSLGLAVSRLHALLSPSLSSSACSRCASAVNLKAVVLRPRMIPKATNGDWLPAVGNLSVVSSTAEEHMEHPATVFDRLQQFGIALNPSKCAFRVLFFIQLTPTASVLFLQRSRLYVISHLPLPNARCSDFRAW
ncbi:hypothetical protein SprV_0200588100 [Sparganum proliferum]